MVSEEGILKNVNLRKVSFAYCVFQLCTPALTQLLQIFGDISEMLPQAVGPTLIEDFEMLRLLTDLLNN